VLAGAFFVVARPGPENEKITSVFPTLYGWTGERRREASLAIENDSDRLSRTRPRVERTQKGRVLQDDPSGGSAVRSLLMDTRRTVARGTVDNPPHGRDEITEEKYR
jgi:hypothetical protein